MVRSVCTFAWADIQLYTATESQFLILHYTTYQLTTDTSWTNTI